MRTLAVSYYYANAHLVKMMYCMMMMILLIITDTKRTKFQY